MQKSSKLFIDTITTVQWVFSKVIFLELAWSQCSKMHSKHLWHNTLIISLEYHFKLTYYYFGIKSNLRLSCPSKNFRFQNFLVIIWHLSWHFVLFLNSKHCFSLNFDFLVTKPFISCEKSAESRLSVRYYLAGVSHYFFEANGSNLIWFCSKGQLKLRHFLLPRYSAINIKSYPSEIINVLCQTCLGGKLEQGTDARSCYHTPQILILDFINFREN